MSHIDESYRINIKQYTPGQTDLATITFGKTKVLRNTKALRHTFMTSYKYTQGGDVIERSTKDHLRPFPF